jgi:hypothetical protein
MNTVAVMGVIVNEQLRGSETLLVPFEIIIVHGQGSMICLITDEVRGYYKNCVTDKLKVAGFTYL